MEIVMVQNTLVTLSLLGFLISCTTLSSNRSVGYCEVTQPPKPPFSPPIDAHYNGRFWYGTPALWTNLPADGIWQGLQQDQDGYVQKIVIWREDFNALEEPNPVLTVTGRRLDASTPTFAFSQATHGWDETGDFMLMGINIPTEGCWEITATYQDAKLTYVIKIIP